MQRYAILRKVEPTMTREEVDTAAIQTLFNMNALNVPIDQAWDTRFTIESGLSWVRSYWQQGSDWGLCLYTGRDDEAIQLYHDRCDVPYVSFSPIEELASPLHTEPGTGKTLYHNEAVVLAIDATLPHSVAVSHALFDDYLALFGALGQARVEGITDGIHWIRTYWDNAKRHAVAVYTIPSTETADALKAALAGTDAIVRPITEVYPDEYSLG